MGFVLLEVKEMTFSQVGAYHLARVLNPSSTVSPLLPVHTLIVPALAIRPLHPY